jgi:hypothetical protein
VSFPSRIAPATIIAGLGLFIPAGIGLLLSDTPTKLCPLPALTYWPALFLSAPFTVCLPTLIFVVWFPSGVKIPWRSYALLAVAAPLNVIYCFGGWRRGLEYQGLEYTRVVCSLSITWMVFLVFAFALFWKGCSLRYSLLLHWMLFAWLVWYAFPYLGEML